MAFKNLSSTPLVSIITPSYNSGRYIEECIQSVLNQDYPNVEHIIQDGASTDKTLSIIKKYSQGAGEGRIKWVSEPDNGPVQASNRALRRAKGEIILFFGSDCILLPHACSYAVGNLAKNPKVAVVYGDEYIIDEKNNVIKKYIPNKYDFVKLLCNELIPPAEAAFIRRSAFEKIGFYLDESFKYSIDYELWIRLGLNSKFLHINKFFSKFRWHKESITMSPKLVNNFIEDKQKIIKRVFARFNSYRRYKKRAYIGLNFWGGIMLINSGAKITSIKYFFRAWLIKPSWEQIKYFFSVWKQAVKDQKSLSTLVSVITTFDSNTKAPDECIKSIISQDYPNVEHVIFYPSYSYKIKQTLKRYRKTQYEHRIIMFARSSKTKNEDLVGIKKANGNIIVFADAKNTFTPKAITHGVKDLKKYPSAGIIQYSNKVMKGQGQYTPNNIFFIRKHSLEKLGFWKEKSWDKLSTTELLYKILLKIPTKNIHLKHEKI